ncbi:zinc finger protein OZF isoform X1 [Hydra vulgaris]|uniref:zinc finger protein OZF isoform X1 n=1 Tax=Hydra vulgaris TaxID=6087 RepID=UPI001F5FAC50|nr:zinc finger protein OZF [Hydra vulgaris]
MENKHEIEITIGEPIAIKILDTCVGTDNQRYYKIQWQPTWETEEDILLKYQTLVEEYWKFSTHQKLGILNTEASILSKTVENDVNSPELKEVSVSDNVQKKPPPLMPEKYQYVNRPFQCEICLRCYTSEKKMNEHKHKLHLTKAFYQCTYCTKVFVTNRNLQNHMNRHTGIGPHLCLGCSKHYMTEQALEHHKRSCNGLVEKEFHCKICGKAFSTKPHLTFHMKIHLPDNQKPFKCQFCPRTFAYNHDCIHHMRLHVGEKPFKCTECNEAFHRKSYLTEHMFLHTGISKYKCSDCEKYFKTQQMLQTHVKNVHILKKSVSYDNKKANKVRGRYRCEDCSQVFCFMKEYHHHLAVNHEDTSHLENINYEPKMVYKCKKCTKTFRRSSSLKKHTETHKRNISSSISLCKTELNVIQKTNPITINHILEIGCALNVNSNVQIVHDDSNKDLGHKGCKVLARNEKPVGLHEEVLHCFSEDEVTKNITEDFSKINADIVT